MTTMRRWAVGVVGVLLAGVLLAGCSAESPPATPTAPPPTAVQPTATAAQATATAPAGTEPAATAPPVATPTVTPTPARDETTFYYGIMQPVSAREEIVSAESITARLSAVQAQGSNVTLQLFDPDLAPEVWRTYLDAAQEVGVQVIGRLGPVDWNPDPDDLTPILQVLDAVAGHPALYGFIYLHEPLEVMTGQQIEAIYSQIKQQHPDVRLGVIWSGEIERVARRGDARRYFADGMCDICLVNMKAFQNDADSGYRDGPLRLLDSAVEIAAKDPDAELWSSVQVWAPPGDGGRRGFRVPDSAEMAELFCSLHDQLPLRGFIWAAWTLPMNNIPALSDDVMTAQRNAILDIYQSCVQSP